MHQEDLSRLRPDRNDAIGAGVSNRYVVGLAASESEVQETQALRYQVFAGELGAQLDAEAAQIGLDVDRYDAFCDHLLVRDCHSQEVVGTYRILSPHAACMAGGYYSESEFCLEPLANIRNGMVEVGRSCVHPEHRSGAVVTLLWSGLISYMRARGHRYLAGCASISLADGGRSAASVYKTVCHNHSGPESWRVMPHRPARLLERFPDVHTCPPAQMPPLIKGYLRVGAYICGEPAWDADFNTADLFLLLPMDRMSPRYTQHFLRSPALPMAA